MKFKNWVLSLSVSAMAMASAFAGLPEGTFRGKSSLIKRPLFILPQPDLMTFFVRNDPSNSNRSYVVLAHYDRIPLTNFNQTTAVTKWVKRMYAYRVDRTGDLEYAMHPLSVTDQGELAVDEQVKAGSLTLKTHGEMRGAKLTRYRADETVAEKIEINGRAISTWEDIISGKYLWSFKSSGLDYINKASNTEISEDGTVTFDMDDVKGAFSSTLVAPGIYTLRATSDDVVGRKQIETKLAVFIDIMNWKPKATTNEMLLIDPSDASNVGFFYEKKK